MPITGLNIVTDAAQEINLFDSGQPLGPDDAAYILGKLNRLLDLWNANQQAVPAALFQTFVIAPAASPHTIGPLGTWVTATRPQAIDAAALIIGTGATAVRTPIWIRDEQWWQGVTLQGMSAAIVTDLYYDPDFPLGKVFLWPVPTTAYRVELQTRDVLAALTLTSVFSMAPGYQEAITLSLAETLGTPHGTPIPPDVVKRAAAARAIVFSANVTTPRLETADAGMPGGRQAGGFNYRTGLPR